MGTGRVARREFLLVLIASAFFLALSSCGGGGDDGGGGGGERGGSGSAPPNRGPVAQGSIASQILTAGETATVFVSSYFDDPDGDALIYEIRQSPDSSGIVTVSVSGSRVTLHAVGTGAAVVRVFATDPGELFASQDFSVGVAPAGRPNRSPVAGESIPDQDLEVGETTRLFLLTHFDDPDGDTLTYTTTESSNAGGIVTVSVAGSGVTSHVNLRAIGAGTAAVRFWLPGTPTACPCFRISRFG